jgi:hypothetical protein
VEQSLTRQFYRRVSLTFRASSLRSRAYILANTCSFRLKSAVRRQKTEFAGIGVARRRDQQGGGFDARVGADFSMRNTVSHSPRSMLSKWSPTTPTK